MCGFCDPNLVTFYFYELTQFLDWMRNTLLFFSSDKLSGTFANRKYEEQSYLKKSENVRALSSNSIQNTTPL